MSAPKYEQLKNGPQTTLNGGINNSTTTVVVTDASAFPSDGNFRILIDTEIFLVTAVSSNTFTVAARPQEGTSAASHSDLATVTHILTAGAMSAYRSDASLYDTFANRPSAGVLGRVFYPSDSDIIFYDDGSNWQSRGPCQRLWTPPSAASFSQDNFSGTAAIADANGKVILTSNPLAGQSFNLVGAYITKPSTPYSIEVNLAHDCFPSSNVGTDFGLYIRDSSTGRIIIHDLYFEPDSTATGGPQVGLWEFIDFNNNNTAELNYKYTAVSHQNFWVRFRDDGTNRIFSISNDGFTWYQLDTRAHTYVASTYNHVGFYVMTRLNATSWLVPPAVQLRSWKQGT